MISNGNLPERALDLLVGKPNCSNFYMLPKIHKIGNPGRPVVSSCSCPTSLISKYLSESLKPIVRNLPSYVKDTNHALKMIDDVRISADGKMIAFSVYRREVSKFFLCFPVSD